MSDKLDALSMNNTPPNPYHAERKKIQARIESERHRADRRERIVRTILGIALGVCFVTCLLSIIAGIWTGYMVLANICLTAICIMIAIAAGWMAWEYLR